MFYRWINLKEDTGKTVHVRKRDIVCVEFARPSSDGFRVVKLSLSNREVTINLTFAQSENLRRQLKIKD